MNDTVTIILGFVLYALLFVLIIGLPVYLIRCLIKRRKNKSINPLKKGIFIITPEEEEKEIIGFGIAGIYYRENKDQIYHELNLIDLGDEFHLQPESDNVYDENAIKVLSPFHTHFGYVPKHLTYKFRDDNDNLIFHKCIVEGIERGLNVKIFIKCYPIKALK